MATASAKATATGTLGFTVDWSVFLPSEVLPDTGPKEFQVGEVYAVRCDDAPAVIGIVELVVEDSQSGAWITVLSGDKWRDGIFQPDSLGARHSQRIDAPVAKMWADKARGT